MGIQIFKSTDAGAPALNGSGSSLLPFLAAILENGYNSQTVTSITRAGGVATATKVGHGFVERQTIRAAGAAQSEYNGDVRIFNVTADTYDYAVTGSPASPATGALTAKVAPIDNFQLFATNGTNRAIYRPAVGGPERPFYIFNDQGQSSLNAGANSLLDISTVLGPFGGGYVLHSSTADGTARPWIIVSDGQFVLWLIAHHATYPTGFVPYGFGRINANNPNDRYPHIWWNNATNTLHTPGAAPACKINSFLIAAQNTSTVQYVRNGYFWKQADGSKLNSQLAIVSAFSLSDRNNVNAAAVIGGPMANKPITYAVSNPNLADDGVYFKNLLAAELTDSRPFHPGYRGIVPGVYDSFQYRPLSHLQVVISTAPQTSGREMMAVNLGDPGSAAWEQGQITVDLTGPWRPA